MKKYFFLSTLFISVLLINSCKKEPEPVASFSMDKNNVLVPATIIFTNQSTDATSYNWDFGDGSVSTIESPTHEYTSSGTFTVTLTAMGEGGTNSTSQNVTTLPSLTGKWNKTLYISGDEFNGSMNLIQNENNKLTGDFVFSDGSGYTQLLYSSEISGTSVVIEWMLESYKCSFQGNVSSNYDFMSGSWYANGVYVDNWFATKILKKSAVINDSNSINSEKDRLLKIFNK